MSGRFPFYKQSFIINMIAVVVLVLITIIILGNPFVKPVPSPISNVIILFISAFLYLIIDLAGLSLLKRIKQNREISLQIINRLSIALFLQFIVQLVLAYELFIIFKILYDISPFSSFIPGVFYAQIFLIVIPDIVIFLTASFNIYATIKLMRLGRQRQNEYKGTPDASCADDKLL